MIYKDSARAVCDDSFGPEEAAVACMELYGNPSFIEYSPGHACKHSDFWADDLICTGNENKVAECEHSPWG